MATEPPSLCIFDLDGTLVDSLRDIAEAFNNALELLGLPTRPVEQYGYLVGEGMVKLGERVAGQKYAHLVARLVELARPRYRLRPLAFTKPFTGVPELIGRLRDAGIKLAVLSNKPHDMTRLIVREFWPGDIFKQIRGYKPPNPLKPDPRSTLQICSQLGVKPENAWFIGDTPTDIETARRSGAVSIAVTWGYRSKNDLLRCHPDLIVDSPDELVEAVVGKTSH